MKRALPAYLILLFALLNSKANAQCTISGNYSTPASFLAAVAPLLTAPNNCTVITYINGTLTLSGNASLNIPASWSLVLGTNGKISAGGNTSITSVNAITLSTTTSSITFASGSTMTTVGTTPTTYTYTASTFSPSGIVTGPTVLGPGGVLPVVLTYFGGTVSGKTVNLQWITSCEINSKGFSIERSFDGLNFTEVGFVPSQAATSTLTRRYNFTDMPAMNGNVFYRLHQVDIDGRSSYSRIVSFNVNDDKLSVFPNPAKGIVSFTKKVPENVLVVITNSVGTVVKQRVFNNSINVSGLLPGIYYLKVDGFSDTKFSIIVQ